MSILTKRSKLLISDCTLWEDTRPPVYSNWIFLWTYVWAPVNFHIWIQFKRINLRKTTIHISQEIKSLFSFQIICCEDDILIQNYLKCWYKITLLFSCTIHTEVILVVDIRLHSFIILVFWGWHIKSAWLHSLHPEN